MVKYEIIDFTSLTSLLWYTYSYIVNKQIVYPENIVVLHKI